MTEFSKIFWPAGVALGFILATLLSWKIIDTNGGYLAEAQRQYAQCIAVGAPRENCLKTYLLPAAETRP